MSKLYDAIKKIENNKNQKEEIPFAKQRKRNEKTKKRLIILSLLVSIFVLSGLFIVVGLKHNKSIGVDREKKSKTVAVKSAAVKKIVKPKKADNSVKVEREKESVDKVKVEKTAKAESKVKQRKIYNTSITKNKTNNIAVKKKEEKRQDKKLTANVSKKQKPTISVAELVRIAENGSDREAISAYKRLIEIFPDNLDLYNNLAVRYMDIGEYDKAAEILRKALSVGDSADIRLNYTLALVKLRKLKEAKEEIKTINIEEVNDKKLYYALISILSSHP